MNSMGGYGGVKGPTGSAAGMNPSGGLNFKPNKPPEGYNLYKQYSPAMMDLYSSLYSHVNPDSFTSRLAGGDQSMFEQLEAPAMKQFQQLMSQNASQFSGMGMGARHGSGFANTQNQATADFASQLQSQRMDYMRNALKDLMGFSSNLLEHNPYALAEKPMPFWQQFLLSLAGGASQGAGQVGGAKSMSAMGL